MEISKSKSLLLFVNVGQNSLSESNVTALKANSNENLQAKISTTTAVTKQNAPIVQSEQSTQNVPERSLEKSKKIQIEFVFIYQ